MTTPAPDDTDERPRDVASSATTPREMGQPPNLDRFRRGAVALVETIARLRSPSGCPWDREQTLASIKPYTLEEVHELLEAIDADDNAAICDELGDVLLQVVLDAQIAADEGRFDLNDVVETLTAKMIRRHPHVFGDETAATAEDVRRHWQAVKEKESASTDDGSPDDALPSHLAGVPIALPALARAAKLSKRAAAVGYDWPHRAMLLDKLQEELDELRIELLAAGELPSLPAGIEGPVVRDEEVDAEVRDRIEEECGDLLFVVANIARRWGVNPEEALRRTNAKFMRRFAAIEAGCHAAGVSLETATLDQMEVFYQAEKRREKQANAH